jgi:hypothetical protein
MNLQMEMENNTFCNKKWIKNRHWQLTCYLPNLLIYLGKFGQVWESLGKFGRVWASLCKFGQVWASLGEFVQV